uniref:Phosphatidic acid phosphatase type 2/haloperoxidase domain-containing protein n=2 Tax=Lotharella globosa TaxID=91324 RepID=A0A6V3JVJ3_9EUKA
MMLAMASSAYLFPEHPYTMAVVGTVVGINRMFVGAHYLHDVIIGAIIGPAVTWAYMRYAVHETYIEPYLHSISGRMELAVMTLPICLVVGLLSLRALKLKDPKEWEMKANSSHTNFRPLDTTQAHLKQFSGMYGLLLSLVAFVPPQIPELEAIKHHTRNIYARILLGQFLVVGTFLTIAAISPKNPSWAMHLCRALRYASVPSVVMCACAPIFRSIGI